MQNILDRYEAEIGPMSTQLREKKSTLNRVITEMKSFLSEVLGYGVGTVTWVSGQVDSGIESNSRIHVVNGLPRSERHECVTLTICHGKLVMTNESRNALKLSDTEFVIEGGLEQMFPMYDVLKEDVLGGGPSTVRIKGLMGEAFDLSVQIEKDWEQVKEVKMKFRDEISGFIDGWSGQTIPVRGSKNVELRVGAVSVPELTIFRRMFKGYVRSPYGPVFPLNIHRNIILNP